MNKLSRSAIAAIAAAIAIPAGVAIARHGDHGGWHRMSPEARERLDEGKLAMVKTALRLNPEQDKLWAALETEIRAGFKMRAERMAEHEKKREERRKSNDEAKNERKETAGGKPDIAERITKMSERMSARADRIKAFAAAFTPFYASLSDEQKEVMQPLLRNLMGGKGGHGKHWAMGGDWGGHGKWGHGGGWHHRGYHGGDRGDRMERGGGSGDAERRPPAEQLLPGVDEGTGPDSL